MTYSFELLEEAEACDGVDDALVGFGIGLTLGSMFVC